jgi:hypothetical protein
MRDVNLFSRAHNLIHNEIPEISAEKKLRRGNARGNLAECHYGAAGLL